MNQILKADGSVHSSESVQDKCEHKDTQTFQGAGRTPERTVCVDCKEEL